MERAMDESVKELAGQIENAIDHPLQGIDGGSGESIARLIQEARDEAFGEARAVLKRLMLQAILERALCQFTASSVPDVHAVPVAPVADPAVDLPPEHASPQHGQDRPQEEAQIQVEIEAIKRQIAENERLLNQARPAAREAQEAQKPAVEEQLSPTERIAGTLEETEEGYYVYGIVRGDAGPLDTSPPGKGLAGIDPDYPVYTTSYRAIQAVVSKVSLQEFGHRALEENLNDMSWVEAKARAHQGVLEAVLADRVVVPMRFCTIYCSEDGIQQKLRQYYDNFVADLARLEGRQEWGVKVYCDEETLALQVERVSDRVKALREEMEAKTEGAAYFLHKKVAEIRAQEVERVSDEHAQRYHDCLSDLAEEVVVTPLQGPGAGRKETMILNGAYLVSDERLAAFRTGLERLGEEGKDLGFSYEITGPWPPYNFVAVDAEEGTVDEPVGS